MKELKICVMLSSAPLTTTGKRPPGQIIILNLVFYKETNILVIRELTLLSRVFKYNFLCVFLQQYSK